MTVWLMSANAHKFDHYRAFHENGFIHWRQIRRFEIGDKVFIYCTKPIGKIMYYCEVEAVDIESTSIECEKKYYANVTNFVEGKYIKVRLIAENSKDKLSMDDLGQFGFMPPQGPQRMSNSNEVDYILSVFKETKHE